jgi:twitching motility protein PilU
MQTFDTAIFRLYQEGKISFDEAIKNADSANNLRLKIKLSDDEPGGDSAGYSLSLEKMPEDEEDDDAPINPFLPKT